MQLAAGGRAKNDHAAGVGELRQARHHGGDLLGRDGPGGGGHAGWRVGMRLGTHLASLWPQRDRGRPEIGYTRSCWTPATFADIWMKSKPCWRSAAPASTWNACG